MRPDDSGNLPKPTRRTTKRFFVFGMVLSFGTLWLALIMAPETIQWLATPAFMAIVGLYAAYTGSGTADFFAVMGAQSGRQSGGYDSGRFAGEVPNDLPG